ncbi:hypothetical protein BBD66_09365 [Mammaliicoccus sciuri]|uniref:ABC transporter permease subunit n=2 Tax=Mammaliicoccus sciuri TaxID=1296 RepID=UPI0008076E31|nr:ABC transporter permease subunit [Mammaliicoccus sciuri]MCD8761826.1 ABC transporter permease subunit [Mammaliicoccus sciuri]MCD8771459.1 ABC transporter permease subunit [Mammaliicoccus sciuri]MCD8847301.1 ABC transporter permease subunit [Mammaliicoccus sciuri]MCJ0970311.1 ABC transporter permease subunit [Mammaliicoccus sciuri]MEB6097115.1 ABC transporter permease subunit [Mammaliicoccus sciuri]
MRKLFNFTMTIIVFLLLACLPALFDDQRFSFLNYLNALKSTFLYIFHPQDIIFTNKISHVERSLFPFFIEPWINTIVILFAALLLAFIVSLLFTYLLYVNDHIKKWYLKINTVLSIIPDIFYIPFSISLVILFYRYTDILLFNVANSSEDKALIFPILVLSIIPLVSSVTFLSSILDDVSRADYIEFSRAKGLSNVELYFKHILRNLFASYLINFKHIIWITLSSLLLLERIFNMHGLSSFIFDYGSPEVLFVTFILIYVPVSLAIFMSHKVLFTITGVRGGLS